MIGCNFIDKMGELSKLIELFGQIILNSVLKYSNFDGVVSLVS